MIIKTTTNTHKQPDTGIYVNLAANFEYKTVKVRHQTKMYKTLFTLQMLYDVYFVCIYSLIFWYICCPKHLSQLASEILIMLVVG